MTLIFKGYVWYLFAYCRVRKDFRIFRLSRMKNISPLDEAFIRRKASYQDYFRESMSPDESKVNIAHLVLKFSPRVQFRVEDYFDEEQIHGQDNGDLIVRVSFPEDEWVYSLILSYGEHVEVLEPARIRKIIQEKVKKSKQSTNLTIVAVGPPVAGRPPHRSGHEELPHLMLCIYI